MKSFCQRIVTFLVVCMAVAALAGCTAQVPSDSAQPGATSPNAVQVEEGASHTAADDRPAYESDSVLVQLSEGVDAEQAVEQLSALPGLEGIALDSEVSDGFVQLSLPAGVTVEDAVDLIESSGLVAAAQPNYLYYLQGDALAAQAADHVSALVAGTTLGTALSIQSITPNDPGYERQWYLASMNAPEAWQVAAASASQANPVTIAVMDADFQYAHGDLAANVRARYDQVGRHGSSQNISHGTHVAGTIAAVANNGIGVAGVTFNTCKVYLMRVSDRYEEITTTVIVAAYKRLVQEASKYNIRVVSMSLGAGSAQAVARSTDTALYDAIDSARNAGIVTVVAACNAEDSFSPPFYAFPSDFDNVVSVINLGRAANADGVARDSSSNYNKGSQKAKNIAAPGEEIYSLTRFLYGYMSGTSMATPSIAGVLGLMFTANPQLSADEAVSKLYSTARDLTGSAGASTGWDRVTGFGEVDAAAAVSAGAAYLSGNSVVKGKSAFKVKVNGVAQNASAWTWTSSNPEVARPTANGVVYGYAKGDAIITAKKGKSVAVQVVHVTQAATNMVKPQVSSLRVSVAKRVYTGEKRKPAPAVYDGAMKLTAGTHYTVSYAANLNAGKAKVKIKGKGAYAGTVTKSFTIKKASLSKAKVKAKSGTSVKVYDIGRNKSRKLVRGVDYKTKMVGNGIVKITATSACRNFTGSRKVALGA